MSGSGIAPNNVCVRRKKRHEGPSQVGNRHFETSLKNPLHVHALFLADKCVRKRDTLQVFVENG